MVDTFIPHHPLCGTGVVAHPLAMPAHRITLLHGDHRGHLLFIDVAAVRLVYKSRPGLDFDHFKGSHLYAISVGLVPTEKTWQRQPHGHEVCGRHDRREHDWRETLVTSAELPGGPERARFMITENAFAVHERCLDTEPASTARLFWCNIGTTYRWRWP